VFKRKKNLLGTVPELYPALTHAKKIPPQLMLKVAGPRI
jgi:hypothetical protein